MPVFGFTDQHRALSVDVICGGKTAARKNDTPRRSCNHSSVPSSLRAEQSEWALSVSDEDLKLRSWSDQETERLTQLSFGKRDLSIASSRCILSKLTLSRKPRIEVIYDGVLTYRPGLIGPFSAQICAEEESYAQISAICDFAQWIHGKRLPDNTGICGIDPNGILAQLF